MDDAMFKMTTSACVEAPADVVWAHLARLDQISVWTDVIHRAHVSGTCSAGVGAERTCELGGGRALHERFVAWDEGRSFTYESTDAPMMKLARNKWSVTPMGARSLVTSEAEMEFRGGWLGRILGFVLVPLMTLVLPNPLAKLKFWIENGRPFEGRARALPVPSVAC
jgi:ligand-binding SRPBCC domain-containing protein